MKKILIILALLVSNMGLQSIQPVFAYNFGDFRSETLVKKSWAALAEGDVEAVLAYTNKVMELYAEQAKEMQEGLSDYVKGENEEIFGYWALNDVATSLFIQGEAYRRANMEDEAVAAYKKLINDYTYGQTWDVNGWFWKPAEAAKEKMAMIDSGSYIDFGDYSSSFLVGQAWRVLPTAKEDIDTLITYTDKVLNLYEEKAKEMQNSLTEYPWQSKEQIFRYWALNDVGTALYIKANGLAKAGKTDESKKVYQTLIDDYFYAQCWDPQGWFWKPAEAAQEALDSL